MRCDMKGASLRWFYLVSIYTLDADAFPRKRCQTYLDKDVWSCIIPRTEVTTAMVGRAAASEDQQR